MLIKKTPNWHVSETEITPESVWLDRRNILKAAGFLGAGALFSPLFPRHAEAAKLGIDKAIQNIAYRHMPGRDGDITEYNDKITYNNFYEFGTDKTDPANAAPSLLKTDPWSVVVEGAVENPGTYAYEDLIKPHQLEERVYRFRCVEAWSAVVPWVGIPLSAVIKALGPTSDAKYVYFETLLDPEQMPGQNSRVLEWPYREGLRMDEAMNDLTLLTVGMYGKELLPQSGAPIRLVVPWKYGFKSIKSIVKIRFQKDQPPTSWNMAGPSEYGFYSNVNPSVEHPRWSQAKERRLGGGFFQRKQPTLMFNGYEDQVAGLYKGMDLQKNY